MTVIDAHVHVIVPELLRPAAPEQTWRPGAISVLGAVPFQDPELAAVELATLMSGGEFAGVEVAAGVCGAQRGA